jgi:hypothetical protein
MRKASTRMLEQGTQRRPLLQTSSPLKTNNETQPETLIRIGTTNGGTSDQHFLFLQMDAILR